ncbi:MAG: AfsR/SARP family transcriptional regulator [Acidimicrobiales bacterium]
MLRCLGGFRLVVGGEPLETTSAKPRSRAALRLLAMHAGRSVHREVLVEALWPEVDPQVGIRNLQVTISSLRRLLEPQAPRRTSSFVVREDGAYRLALPPSSDVDLWMFEEAFTEARSAVATGAHDVAAAALQRARTAYGGDLLPEDGPAEWVVQERERLRLAAVDVAQADAQLALDRGAAVAAVGACEWGLRIDRYHDPLWRLLTEAHERAGDRAAALRTRRAYDDTLAELGLPPDLQRAG